MLTVLSMLVGFISSLAPELLKRWQDASDKAHELAILDKQMTQAENAHLYKMDEIGVSAYSQIVQSAHKEQADITAKASRWVVNLAASVRPIITYLFIISFMGFKMCAMAALLNPSLPWQSAVSFADAMLVVWSDEDKAIVAGILAYWFGDRSLTTGKRRAG